MPPKAAVEDFDDDTDFDLPTIGAAAPSQQQPQASQQDQMAAFQKMMEQMQMGQGQAPAGLGDFGSSRPPAAASRSAAAAKDAGSDEHKKWISVYPIYFDAKRHYGKGCRRVAYDKASPFPTGLWIAKAVGRLNLLYIQEPYKTHPQDWENPGRVKVKLFDEDGKPLHAKFSNKKQLFDAIAEILQPNCGGKPPALEPRTKRVKPAAFKATALAENAKARAEGAAPAAKKGRKPASSSSSASNPSKPSLTRKQRQELARMRRDPNPNPIRQRLAAIKFPPRLEDRLPEHSPALEGGVLNMNLAEAMGGMPPGIGGPGGAGGMMEQLGPLGGMLGGMGLGGGDDDDDEDDEAEAEALKKKGQDKQMPNLSRRQKKKVVRIGR